MPNTRSGQPRSTKARRCLFGKSDHRVIKDALDEQIKNIIEEDTKRLMSDFTAFQRVSAENIPSFYKRVRGQRVYVDDSDEGSPFPRLAKSPPVVSPAKPQDTILALTDEAPSTSSSHSKESKPTITSLPSPAKKPRTDKMNPLGHRPSTRSMSRLFESKVAFEQKAGDLSIVGKETNRKKDNGNASVKTGGKAQLQSCLTNYLQPERKLLTAQAKNEGKNAIKHLAVHRNRENSAPSSPLRFLVEDVDGTLTKTYIDKRKEETSIVKKKSLSQKALTKSASVSRISHAGGLKAEIPK